MDGPGVHQHHYQQQERRRQNNSSPPSSSEPTSIDATVHGLKELIVRLTYDVNSITDCIRRVDTHISDEGYLDAKVINALLPVATDTSDSNHMLLDLPREAKHLSQGLHAMMKTIRGAFLSVSDCTELSKKTYHDQLRKMRDVSNAATRNAVLAEKIEASAAMKHLRVLLEADKQQTIDTLQRRIDDSHTDIERLQEQLNVARADIAKMQVKEMHAAEETARAIARALDVQRDTFEREKSAQLRWLKEDNQRLKIEASQTMGDTMERHKVYTDNQRQQYEEAKSILQGDKTRLEADRDQLRRELTDTLAKLAVERGTINERMKEERMQWEQELRDSRKEAVRMQAALRTEALTALDRSKAQLEVWHHERYAEQQQEYDREHRALIAENERLQALLLRSQIDTQPLRSIDMNVTKSSSSSNSSTSYFAAAMRPSVTVTAAPMPLAFPVPPSVSVHTMHVESSATEEEKGKDTDDYYRVQQEQVRQCFTPKNQYHNTIPTSLVGSAQSGTNNQQSLGNNSHVKDLGTMLLSDMATRTREAASVESTVDKVTTVTVQGHPGNSGANSSADMEDVLLNDPTSSLPKTMASSVSKAIDRDHADRTGSAAAADASQSTLAALLADADAQIQTLGVRSRSPSPPPPPPHAAMYAPAGTVTAATMQHSYVKSTADMTAPISHHSQISTVPSSSSSRRFADTSSPVVPRLSTLLQATSDARKDSGMAVNTTEGNSLEDVEEEIRRRLRNIGATLSPGKKRASPTVAVTAATAVSRNASSALGWGLLKKSLEMQEAEEVPTRPSPSQRQLQAASTYMALHSAHNRTKTTTGTPPGTHVHRGGFGGRSTSASPSSSSSSASSRISPGFNERKTVSIPPLPAGSPLTRGTGNTSSTMSMFRRGSPDASSGLSAGAAAGAWGVRSARSNSPVVRASSATSTTSNPVQSGRRTKPPSMTMSPSSLANESRLDDFLGKLGRYIDEQDAEEGNDGDDGDGDDSTSEDSLLNGLHVAFPNPNAPAPPQQKVSQSFQEESDESYETPGSLVGSMLASPK